ncbi:hypothetical protein HELRODRAFT_84390, partial [Helobdella robusta]|uniref:IRS-type PTB domain-containing protein n=1 Tax=Helobdella robusta TaxID=6412 RepID=T1G5I3_HELRO
EPIHVFLLCTPLLSFYGECQMIVTHGNLLLCHPNDPTQTFLAWPLTSIKKYTCDKDKFIMQTGRSCKTGEGLFIFNTRMGPMIVKRIKVSFFNLSKVFKPLLINY